MSEGKILEKLGEHDKKFEKIEERLENFEQRLTAHDVRFDSIDQKLEEHGVRLDAIQECLEETITREEFLDSQDKVMVILKRLDQEREITSYTLRKLADTVERHELKLATL